MSRIICITTTNRIIQTKTFVDMTKPTKKRHIDECDEITSAIKRMAIAPHQDASDKKMAKPRRRYRTCKMIKATQVETGEGHCSEAPLMNSISKIDVNIEEQISALLKTIRYNSTNEKETNRNSGLASGNLGVCAGKMKSMRKQQKNKEKPYQKPNTGPKKVRDNEIAPAPSPAPSSTEDRDAGEKATQAQTEEGHCSKAPLTNTISKIDVNIEEQISALLKSIRYNSTNEKETNRNSDPASGNLGVCAGKMKSMSRQEKNKDKPYQKLITGPKNARDNDIVSAPSPAPSSTEDRDAGIKKRNARKSKKDRSKVSRKKNADHLNALCESFASLTLD